MRRGRRRWRGMLLPLPRVEDLSGLLSDMAWCCLVLSSVLRIDFVGCHSGFRSMPLVSAYLGCWCCSMHSPVGFGVGVLCLV